MVSFQSSRVVVLKVEKIESKITGVTRLNPGSVNGSSFMKTEDVVYN